MKIHRMKKVIVILNEIKVPQLSVYPNSATNEIKLMNSEALDKVELYNT